MEKHLDGVKAIKIFVAALLVNMCLLSLVNGAQAVVYVDGYVKGNGTYVAPHIRSNPDSSEYNNYSYWK